jgi:hypothetical protein
MASMIRSLGVSRRTTRRPTGDMNAAAVPCSRRAPMSAQNVWLSAHSSDASEYRDGRGEDVARAEASAGLIAG